MSLKRLLTEFKSKKMKQTCKKLSFFFTQGNDYFLHESSM
jgi:hypothetical protein